MKVFGQELSIGMKRALVVASVVWMFGCYITHKEAVDFSWTVGMSTPSTMCSDVYAPGDDRLAACEAASPLSWSERFLRRQRGEEVEVPFDYYQRAHHDFSVWYWLLGVPLGLWTFAYAIQWVIAGFKEERPTRSGEDS